MRRLLFIGAASLALASVPAAAEEAAPLAEMTDTLKDPATQHQITELTAALSQVLLNFDLSPLAQAAEAVTGEPAQEFQDGTTLRDIAPEAEAMPDAIRREMPRALDRMATMGDALQTMLPMFKEMAETMKRSIDDTAVSVR